MIQVCRPKLPSPEALLPYLRRIDEARYYTNHGQLVEELETRLCAHFGLDDGAAVLASSGTAGLVGAILATAGRAGDTRNLCLCPAFTFAATAIAAVTCGYEPFIADVDPVSWALDPDDLRHLPGLDQVGVVVPVAPMGRTPDLDAWAAFQADTGIPVVMDAAACFDTLDHSQLARCSFPVVVSLHATKTFSTAEGGLVLCADQLLVRPIARALNFGFFDSRESVGPSTNGKLSEYHAAVGLADLDWWNEKRAGFLAAAAAYQAAAGRHGLGPRIVVNTRQAEPYFHYMADDAAAAERAEKALERQLILTRRWYSRGLHVQPAFSGCARTPVPVTEDLAARLIGLPCACDIDSGRIDLIVQTLSSA